MLSQLTNKARDMQVGQRGLDISSHNLAHAGDVNYARQRLDIGDSVTIRDGQLLLGTGIQVERLVDMRNLYLDTQVLQSQMDSGALDGRLKGLNSIQNGLEENIDRRMDSPDLAGAIGANNMPLGISKSIDSLFASFSTWAANPGLAVPKETMIANAQLLAKNFNRVNGYLNQTSNNAISALKQTASNVSQLLGDVALLNQQICTLESGNVGSALDLRGDRQSRLEELGKLIGFSVEASGVNSSAVKLTTLDVNGNEMVLVDASYAIEGLEVSGDDVLVGGIALAVTRGAIAGYQSTLKNDVPSTRASLDALAGQIVTAINTIYNPSGASGHDFFDPNGLQSSTMVVDSGFTLSSIHATSTGLSGANEIALALEDLRSHKFSIANGDAIEGSFLDAYSSIVTGLGQTINVSESQFEAVQLLNEHLVQARSNESGVSYEEELATLMSFSHLFQANLRVLHMYSDCLDELIHAVSR